MEFNFCFFFLSYDFNIYYCLKAGDDGKSTAYLENLIADCLKEYGVTLADLSLSERSGNVSSINPCFYGCYFKKIGYVSISTAVLYKAVYFSV